jgi:hypothetical protein
MVTDTTWCCVRMSWSYCSTSVPSVHSLSSTVEQQISADQVSRRYACPRTHDNQWEVCMLEYTSGGKGRSAHTRQETADRGMHAQGHLRRDGYTKQLTGGMHATAHIWREAQIGAKRDAYSRAHHLNRPHDLLTMMGCILTKLLTSK